MRPLIVMAFALALMVQGCATPFIPTPTPTFACPMSLEELADPALAHEIGPDLVAGTAIAHRFVDTEAVAFRGYDISITSAIAGLADSDQVMFVTTRDRLPGVSLGTDLLVFGRRGPGLLEIRSVGHCQPLISVAP